MSLLPYFFKKPAAFYRYLTLGGRYRYSLKILLRSKIRHADFIAKSIVKGEKGIVELDYKGQQIFMKTENGAVFYMTQGIQKLDKLVSQISLPKNATVIDAGGNVGLFSLFLLRKFPDAKIILIEPSEDLQPILRKNLAAYTRNVTFVKKALTNQNGTTIFYINKNAEQTNSTDFAAVQPFIQNKSEVTEVEVETVTLETLLKNHTIDKIDLLKLDIQGGEFSVLQNSVNLFSHIEKLLIEVSFLTEDNVKLCGFVNAHYPKSKVLGEVKMGADILFERK